MSNCFGEHVFNSWVKQFLPKLYLPLIQTPDYRSSFPLRIEGLTQT